MRTELRRFWRQSVVDMWEAAAGSVHARFDPAFLRTFFIAASMLLSGAAAGAAEPTWTSLPAVQQYRVEVVDQPLPVFIDSTEACVYAARAVQARSPDSGWQYSNAHYVPLGQTQYAGCHHTLTAVGPNAGGYPIGTVLQGYGQDWVIPVPSCPAGFTMLSAGDSAWRCGRWSHVAAPGKPSQCNVPSTEFGNPIACAAGSKVERRSDLVFSEFSIDQQFSSAYGPQLSPFGKNWSSILTAEVQGDRVGEGAVFVYLPTGGVVPFVKLANGIWTTQQSDLIAYDLKERFNTDGSFVGWRLKAGSTVHAFDKSGRISAVERNGVLQVSIIRNDVGEPTRLVSPNGRVATLHYQGYMKVDRIDLPGGGVIDYGYDDKGRLTEVSADGATTSYVYGENGGTSWVELIGKLDENGQLASTFSYDTSGRANATENSGGVNRFALSYADSGNHVTVTTPLGAVRNLYFDVFNSGRRLRRQVDECSGCASSEALYDYDAKGLLSQVNHNGLITSYERDAKGRVTSKTEGAGTSQARVTQTLWDDAASLPASVSHYDQAGTKIGSRLFEYNARGQTIKTTQADAVGASRVVTTTYCEPGDIAAGTCPLEGLVKTVDGARSDVADITTYTYRMSDAAGCGTASGACSYRKGDLWKVTDALGHVTETLSYDGAGRPLSVKDSAGTITQYEYHPRGWLTATKVRGGDDSTESDDRITRVAYWPDGSLRQVTQPDGSYISYRYDAAHRLVEVADTAGNTIDYVLDNAGNRIAENTRDPAGTLMRTLSRLFNARGELVTQADASANPTDFAYDINGNNTSVTDALGRVTQNEYDPFNRLKRSVQDVGGIGADSQFKYDALDNLTEVTDPKGLKTTYARNGFGEVVTQTSPDTGVTTFTYDSAGNVLTRTDARGVTANYSYDALGRTTAVTFSDPAADIHYVYDQPSAQCAEGERAGIGRIASMIDPSGRTDYCYSAMGDLVRRVQVVDGQALTLRYTYDAAGRMQSMTYPDGSLVDYSYDALGQVSSVGVTPAGGTREVLLHGVQTLPFGPEQSWTFGNGRRLDRSYDLDYRPVSISDGRDGLNVAFGFDDAGKVASLTDGGPQGQGATLDYDAMGRLTAFNDAQSGVAIEEYSYDATGNRLSFGNSAGTQTYAYPADSHRLASVDGVARTYDAMGNTLTIDGEWQYAYDLAGRLGAATRAGSAQVSYRHNAAGQRVLQQVGTDKILQLHGEAGEWLGSYGASGVSTQQVVWLGSRPVGLIQSGKLLYIESDHLGSPRAVIDPQRDVAVWRWSLLGEAFGDGSADEDPDQDSVVQRFELRFPGQRTEPSSGLSYNYFRDYDPNVGRFAQSDPMGLVAGASTYAYAGGDPIAHLDRDGLQAQRTPVERVPTPPARFMPPAQPPANDPNFGRGLGGALGALRACFSPAGAAILAGVLIPNSTSACDTFDRPPQCGGDEEDPCERLYYQVDIPTCRGVARARGPSAGTRCYAQAAERYAACLSGRPIPPLDTWNN